MLDRAIERPTGRGAESPERQLGPALGWAVVGGVVVLVAAVVLYVLAVSLGQWLAGTPEQALARLASAPMYRQFLAVFLGGFLTVLVAREFDLRTG